MIYELRVYDVIPGKLPALNERFANITMGYFEKYGLKVVGFWTDEVGMSNRLTYMLAFDDMAQRDKAWAGFRADPERAKAFAETAGILHGMCARPWLLPLPRRRRTPLSG